MRVRFKEFNPEKFSFHKDPVLVIEDFWSQEERALFQDALQRSTWKCLTEMPEVKRVFPNCGNWLKAEIGPQEATIFRNRVTLPCIADFIESFPNIKQRHMTFSYYSYGVGDCLSTHDDTGEDYSVERQPHQDHTEGRDRSTQPFPALRRIALVAYLHHRWDHDWGGELIIYNARKGKDGKLNLEVAHCLEPKPGSLVLFSVPRYHRVCRVDPLADSQKRLSIGGWFMTEHHG